MDIQIGTDEAGYGPNLGPLTITGTSWNIPDSEECLYQRLADSIAATPTPNRLTIADSKAVYNSGSSIAALETSVLAALFAMNDDVPDNWLELIGSICDENILARVNIDAWNSQRELKLPLAANLDQVKRLGAQFRKSMVNSQVQLAQICCVPVFPVDFNLSIQELGNKASLLSQSTLGIVQELISQSEFSTAKIVCDKHGGRSKYAGMIQHILTEQFVRIDVESLPISSYHWQDSDQRDLSIHFIAGGESFLPTALASMVSKYTREVFMKLWNNFWVQHIPEIKPTKGYPQDAKRFKKEIATVQAQLGISDDLIWRNR